MLRFYLRELLSDLSFKRGQKVTLKEVSEVTGIGRTTLSKIQSKVGYTTTSEVLDQLCEFFDCEIEDLVKRVKK